MKIVPYHSNWGNVNPSNKQTAVARAHKVTDWWLIPPCVCEIIEVQATEKREILQKKIRVSG